MKSCSFFNKSFFQRKQNVQTTIFLVTHTLKSLVLQAIQASCFMMVCTVYSQTGMYNPLKSNLDSKDNDGLRRGYLVVLSQRLECITHGSIILLLLLSLSFESRLSPLIGRRSSCRINFSKMSLMNVTFTHTRGRHFFLMISQ